MVDTVIVQPGPAQAVVANPTGALTLGTTQSEILGRSGEQVVTQLHGKYYSQAYANKVFVLGTSQAGTTIPIQATNLVSTFTLLNPLQSGVNVELIRYSLGLLSATTVVADISLYYQTGVGSTNAALSSTTALTVRNGVIGSGATAQSQGYSAATFTNTVGTNFFRLLTLGTFGAVTTTNAQPIVYDFDGSIIVPPGTAITVAGTAAQTQAMVQTMIFAEWPV